MRPEDEEIVAESVDHPGKTRRVNAARYTAMKQAMRRVLPHKQPGATQAEIR